MKIGGTTIKSGTKQAVVLPVAKRADGSQISLTVDVCRGVEDGPTFVVDAAVHGDEMEGVETVLTVYRNLDPAKVKGTFIGVPALHPLAFDAGMRIEWSDQKYMAYTAPDMNRVFPGKADGSLAERVAYVYYSEVMKQANWNLCFHGGGNKGIIGPFSSYEDLTTETGKKGLELAKAFGFEMIWKVGKWPGTSMTELGKLGIPASMIEIGGDAMRYPNRSYWLDMGVKGVLNTMKWLGMIEGKPTLLSSYNIVGMDYLKAGVGGIVYQLKGLGEKVKKGEALWKIVNLMGEEVEVGSAPYDCQVAGVRTYPKVQPGDWIYMNAIETTP